MDTELYRAVMDKLYSSCLSKRKFCEKYNIPRGWFIDFANPVLPFRPLRAETIGMLKKNLGIDPILCEDYNRAIYNHKLEIEQIKKESDL